MGTDYSTGEAIVAQVEDLVRIINGKNKAAIVKICQKFCKEDPDQRSEFFGDITEKIKIADLQEKLISLCDIKGEPGKYEGNCTLAHVSV